MQGMENDELATYLNVLARDECCRVDRVLKASEREITELVTFPLENGSVLGPYVRKRIQSAAHIGGAYQELRSAQQAGQRFRHLPSVYDVHERDDELVVLMEYVHGRTLHDEVYERDPSLALACELFPALCDGVIELHEDFARPLIHRDLKPTNVIVNGSSLTIIDFGIARSFREDATADTAPFATRAYAPPEQFGYGQTDERSDVYALGMVLYFLLTERNPAPDLVKRRFAEPEIPLALQRVLVRACAFDPQGRYQSVRALKGAFAEAVTAAVSTAAPQEKPRGSAASVPPPPGMAMGSMPLFVPGAANAPASWASPYPPLQQPQASQAQGPQGPQAQGRPQPQPRPQMPGGQLQAVPGQAPTFAAQPQAPQRQVSAPAFAGQPQGHAPAFAEQPQMSASTFAAAPRPPRPTYRALRQQGATAGQAFWAVVRSLSAGEIVGAVWNAIVVLLWILFAAACLWCPFNPNESMARYTFAIRFLAYIPGMLLFFSGFFYATLDKRILRRFVPLLEKQTFGKGALVGLGLMGIGVVVMLAVFAANYTATGA